MDCYLGIDVGTTAVKVAAINDRGGLIASAERALETIRPRPGWSEQDPDSWVEAVRRAMADVAPNVPGGLWSVLAVGLSGQMHGLVALDDNRLPLRRALLWNDARAASEAEQLNAAAPELAEQLGVPATPSFVAPKWLWLTNNEPEVVSKTDLILFPKDYVRLKLTGVAATDVVDASGGWLLDQARRTWSDQALSLCRLPAKLLPGLHESSSTTGEVTRTGSEYFGLPQGTPVVAGAGDAAAGCVGLRLVRPGQAFINLGTSAQILVTSDRHHPSPVEMIHSFCHAMPGRWFQMAALLNGASVLAWLSTLFGESAADLAQAAAAAWRPDTPLCLPYLSGERTPKNDPYARGLLIGLTPSTSKADLAASVMDGVALALRDSFEALARTGARVTIMGATGGGARDCFWLKLIASALGIPIEVFGSAETGAAVGAALLARSTTFPLADIEPLTASSHVEPDPRMSQIMATRYSQFTQLYGAVKDGFFKGARTTQLTESG